MTLDPRIARLEALLARVRSRSKEPRRGGAGRAPNAREGEAPVARAAMPPPAVEPKLPPPTQPEAEPVERTIRERTLQEKAPVLPPMRVRAPEASQIRPIEPPPLEVIELDLDPDPSVPPPPMEPSREEVYESRSRLVSAPPSMPEEDEWRTGASLAPSEPTLEMGEPAALTPAELDAIDEPAPSSSRRPISVEEKLLALEEDSLHTPPPESGKLPAAAVIDLDDPEVTGVRRNLEESAPAMVAPLTPELTRATPPAGREVAAYAGRVPDFRPATFGELLDATLKL